MKFHTLVKAVITIAFGANAFFVHASDIQPDYEREDRLAAEAEAGLFDGEAIYLSAKGREFQALYMEAPDANLDVAVLVLHGRGFHADWPLVAGPLRVGLNERGWATLSLQMPVLEKDAKYYDYLPILPYSFPRIEAGIEYLRGLGYEKIAVAAHSCSVHMAMAWIEQYGDAEIDAYIGIGMGATDYGQPMKKSFPLDRMTVPVLDVYGSEDYPAVIKFAADRNQQMKDAGNTHSAQIQITDADHFMEDYESELVIVIANWLDSIQKKI